MELGREQNHSGAELNPFRASKVYRIGELARVTSTTTRTLRYYEELDLLQPVRNTAGQRLYDESAITRLNFINELKSGGFSLLEIKSFFENWQKNETGAAASEATMSLIQQKLAEIAELQKKLGRLNDELRAMVHFLVSCRSCQDKPSVENCSVCEKHAHEGPNSTIMKLVAQ